jgi:outer membrane protein OmpA-like peptidoglycan-associated protein
MDLLSLVKEQLTSSAVSKISSFLGESHENTTSALGSAIPSILGGLMQKASTTQGAGELLNTIKTGGHDGGILTNFSNVLGGDATSGLVSTGKGLLGSIFGDKVGALTNIISGVSGIKTGSASSLLSMATPLLMGAIGKQVTSQGMGVSGLTSLLMSQKDSVKAALPAGIGSVLDVNGLGDFFGSAISAAKTAVNSVEKTVEEAKGGMSLLPWLLLGALLLGALYYWKSCRNVPETIGAAMDSTDNTIAAKTDSAALSVVGALKKTLSTGVELNFGEKSIENELIGFIEDKSKPVDKTTWFNFRDLKFETGSAKIDSTSMQEVRNIAEILKAYPTVDLKIGGYTDNVGKDASNMKLSGDRAANVKAALIKKGIDAKRLTTEGYGSQFPLTSNDTEGGRAQNRRIAVRVMKK